MSTVANIFVVVFSALWLIMAVITRAPADVSCESGETRIALWHFMGFAAKWGCIPGRELPYQTIKTSD